MDAADTFNPFDTAVDRDLHPAYDDLRRRCPVSHLGDGLHFVARHADNKAVYRLPKVFSNKGNFVLEDESGTPYPALITQSDPPRHSDLRRLLLTAFSPSAMVEAEHWARSPPFHGHRNAPSFGADRRGVATSRSPPSLDNARQVRPRSTRR